MTAPDPTGRHDGALAKLGQVQERTESVLNHADMSTDPATTQRRCTERLAVIKHLRAVLERHVPEDEHDGLTMCGWCCEEVTWQYPCPDALSAMETVDAMSPVSRP